MRHAVTQVGVRSQIPFPFGCWKCMEENLLYKIKNKEKYRKIPKSMILGGTPRRMCKSGREVA